MVNDLMAVVEIARASFPKAWAEHEYLYFLEHESASCWGVECAGTIETYFLSLQSADELDIVSIATHPRSRKKGLGAELLKHVLYAGTIQRAHLEVGVTNVAAQALYQKLGFQTLGTRKKYYDGREDALVMRWER